MLCIFLLSSFVDSYKSLVLTTCVLIVGGVTDDQGEIGSGMEVLDGKKKRR